MDLRVQNLNAAQPELIRFKSWMVLMWLLYAAKIHSQNSEDEKLICPDKCFCHLYYHPVDGSSIRVECRIGGMTRLPVDRLDHKIHQLIIAPEPSDPNDLIIGPILTQPEPYSNLHDLTLANSNIPSIGKYSFWGLINLNTLNLTGNNISSITTDNFRGLVNLSTLILDWNNINQMASETFRHMDNLKRLSLAHNRISTLVPRLFRMLGKLESLNLSFNPLFDLNPEVFKDIQNLVQFKCRGCGLKRVNAQIYHIARHIEELDLGENSFKYFTDDDFLNLEKLKTLYIDRNQLSVIVDNVFKENFHLKKLDVSHNRIALLAPGSLNNLKGLSHLDISYNRFENMNFQAFAPVAKNLAVIDFSGNNISLTEISTLLQILTELQDIRMSNLSLKIIPPKLFSFNSFLTALDISSNQLTQFPSKLLINTKFLHYLDLSNNRLSSLNDQHLRRLEAIATVHLARNPWDCKSCLVGTMLSYMNTTVLNSTIRGLRCYLPLRLRGAYFSDLTNDQLEPCYPSYEAQVSVVAGLLLVVFSVVVTGVIAWYCTRNRGARYYTNEDKQCERDHDHPEELLANASNGSVSTIHSPYHPAQNI